MQDVLVDYLAAQRQSRIYIHREMFPPAELVATVNAGNARAQLYDDGDSRMLAVEGSNDFYDWLQNLFCVPARGFQNIHLGMQSHALQLHGALDSQVNFRDDGRPFYYVGHSLGGAVAEILPLLNGAPKATRVITFGAPPIFKSDYYARRYHFPVRQYRLAWDVVPDLPLWFHVSPLKLIGGWRHPHRTEFCWFDQNGNAITPDGWHGLRRRWERFKDFARRCREYARRGVLPPIKKILNVWHDHRLYSQLVKLPVVG